MDNKLICKICAKEFKNYLSITSHISKRHKIIVKDYYDKFFKEENEDVCTYSKCNNKTVFDGINNGYRECCSSKCSNNLPRRLEESKLNTKKLWNDQKYTKKMSDKMKERWNKEDFREMMTTSGTDFRKEQAKKMIKMYKESSSREKTSEAVKKAYDDPTLKEKISEGLKKAHKNDPSIAKRMSESIKQYYNNHLEARIEAGERSRRNWGDSNIREQMICSLKEKAKDPEYIKQKRNTALKLAEDPKWIKKVSEGTKKAFKNNPESQEKRRKYLLNGGAAHAASFITNPSKPQVELYNLTKELYSESILNYQILNFNIDIAIPSHKIAIEYDGSYWHQNQEHDQHRQEKIEKKGWIFLRYLDIVPSVDKLKKDINKLINNE